MSMWIAGLSGYRRFKNFPWAWKPLKNWYSFCLTGDCASFTWLSTWAWRRKLWSRVLVTRVSWLVMPTISHWDAHTAMGLQKKPHPEMLPVKVQLTWRSMLTPGKKDLEYDILYTLKYQNQNVLSELLWRLSPHRSWEDHKETKDTIAF